MTPFMANVFTNPRIRDGRALRTKVYNAADFLECLTAPPRKRVLDNLSNITTINRPKFSYIRGIFNSPDFGRKIVDQLNHPNLPARDSDNDWKHTKLLFSVIRLDPDYFIESLLNNQYTVINPNNYSEMKELLFEISSIGEFDQYMQIVFTNDFQNKRFRMMNTECYDRVNDVFSLSDRRNRSTPQPIASPRTTPTDIKPKIINMSPAKKKLEMRIISIFNKSYELKNCAVTDNLNILNFKENKSNYEFNITFKH